MTRNYGIDLIKIISMFFVVTLHVLGFGGILFNAPQFSIYDELGNFIYIMSICAVDVFVICTGYVYAEKIKFKNLINIWFIVLFYSVIITFIFYFLNHSISKVSLITSFFPVFTNQYWFFNEYFALFLFIPLLNLIGNNKKLLQYSIIISIIIFSTITYFLRYDIFKFSGGYGLVWFFVLYLIGVYIKRYTNSIIKNNYYLLFYFIMVIIMMLVLFITQFVALKYFNKNVNGVDAISYNSIWVILEAIFLFLFFKNLKITNNILIKIISFISPLVFSVYLISENNSFRQNVIIDKFSFILNYNPIVYFLSIIGIVLSIYVFCIGIDYVRLQIFNLLKIKNLSGIIEDKLKIIYKKIVIIMDKIL